MTMMTMMMMMMIMTMMMYNYNDFQILLGCGRAGSLLSSNDRWDNTPLHTASARGHTAALLALLEAGAQIDNKNEDEQTPLHIAAKHGKTRYDFSSLVI